MTKYTIGFVFLACWPTASSCSEIPSQSSYEHIMPMFCRGEFDKALEYVNEAISKATSSHSRHKNATREGYRLLRLRTRITEARRWRFVEDDHLNRRSATRNESTELQALSTACTQSYEAAFRRAPTKYEKARLASEWWNLNVQIRFQADSELLRTATLKSMRSSLQRGVKHYRERANIFTMEFRNLLDSAEATKDWPEKRRRVFADLVGREFLDLQCVDVPARVFQELRRDLPLFVREYMPVVNSGNGQTFRNTIKWYLWIATMQRMPDEIERGFIDRDVATFAQRIASEIDKRIQHPLLKRVGTPYAKLFKQSYATLKDNRFIPSFKHVSFPHEKKGGQESLQDCLQQVSESWSEDMSRLGRLGAHGANKEAYKKEQRNYVRMVYSLMLKKFFRFDRPAIRQHFTDERIVLSSAGMNKHLYWVFEVNRSIPFKPFHKKKTR